MWTSLVRFKLGSHPVDTLTVFNVDHGACDNLLVAFMATIRILLLTRLCTGDIAGDSGKEVFMNGVMCPQNTMAGRVWKWCCKTLVSRLQVSVQLGSAAIHHFKGRALC